MRNILIIGCGLLGSSLVRRISKKKIAKKIFIYEKSKSNIAKIKRLRLPGIIVKSLKDGLVNSNLVIVCTSTSEYKKLIIKINKTISPKTLITDVGSSKIESSKIIKKFLKRGINWIRSHPIAGSEVSGPEFGKADMFEDNSIDFCLIDGKARDLCMEKIIPKIKKAAIKFGTTPIKDNLIFLNKIINIPNIPIITKPKVNI